MAAAAIPVLSVISAINPITWAPDAKLLLCAACIPAFWPVRRCNLVEAALSSNALLTIAVIIVKGSKRAFPNPLPSSLKPLNIIWSLEAFCIIFPVAGSTRSDSSANFCISVWASSIALWKIPDLIPSLSINAPVPFTKAPVTPILSSILRCICSSCCSSAILSWWAIFIEIRAANLLAVCASILPCRFNSFWRPEINSSPKLTASCFFSTFLVISSRTFFWVFNCSWSLVNSSSEYTPTDLVLLSRSATNFNCSVCISWAVWSSLDISWCVEYVSASCWA